MSGKVKPICLLLALVTLVFCIIGCSGSAYYHGPHTSYGTLVLNNIPGFLVINGKFQGPD